MISYAQRQPVMSQESVGVEDIALPDSSQSVDTARFFVEGDTAISPSQAVKKERRLELPRMAEATSSDTNRVSRIVRFSVSRSTNDVRLSPIDSSLSEYFVDYPFFKKDVGAVYLGNFGSAVMYFDYFKRNESSPFLFMRPYEPYFFTPDNAFYYNTTTPYTLLYYDWTTPRRTEESQLHVLHTQNITNKLNAGVDYANRSTKGIYNRQLLKNQTLNVFTSYLGDYYKLNAGFVYSSVEVQENGGVADDKLVTDTVIDPEFIPVRLSTAKNTLANISFYLTHSLDLPIWKFGNDSVINNILIGRLGHVFEYSTYGKLYEDSEAVADSGAYYSHAAVSSKSSRDSLGLRNLENRLFVQLRPLRAYIFEQLSAGWGYRSYTAYMFDPQMYLKGSSSDHFHSMFAYASASAWYKQYFQWNAYAESVLSGYRSGDYKLEAGLTLSAYPIKQGIHLKANVLMESKTPDYFLQNYFTNHYEWRDNNFDKTQELRIEGSLSIPQTRTEIGVRQSVLTSYIFFGNDAVPVQASGAVSVSSLSLDQNFKLGSFYMNHRVLLQLSSDKEVLPLPLASLNFMYCYEQPIVKGVLTGQLGVNLRYSTEFNGYGYNPSVGMFHTTSDAKLGNYPWFDVFLAFRWYKVTPYVKWEHVNQSWFTGADNNYFSAVHYPGNNRVFKFGLSWKFLD
jgi:hypothetical protein